MALRDFLRRDDPRLAPINRVRALAIVGAVIEVLKHTCYTSGIEALPAAGDTLRPSRVIWFRDFEFTEDGRVCTSNSNLPAYAHEDRLPAFVCIQPDVHDRGSLVPEHQSIRSSVKTGWRYGPAQPRRVERDGQRG